MESSHLETRYWQERKRTQTSFECPCSWSMDPWDERRRTTENKIRLFFSGRRLYLHTTKSLNVVSEKNKRTLHLGSPESSSSSVIRSVLCSASTLTVVCSLSCTAVRATAASELIFSMRFWGRREEGWTLTLLKVEQHGYSSVQRSSLTHSIGFVDEEIRYPVEICSLTVTTCFFIHVRPKRGPHIL